MAGFFRKAAGALRRRINPTEKDKIRKLIADPPPVEDDLIVFLSSEDYSGNPKALFLYMTEHGYNDRYRMAWLFEDTDSLFEFDIPNVSSVPMYTDSSRSQRTAAAQKAVLSARYVFCSHNVNWARVFRPEQTIVSLWHGCGYKDAQRSDRTKVIYDYLMVTGKKYIDIFRDVMDDPDGNILDLGYPRNEFFTSSRSKAAEYLAGLRASAGSDRSVIWMPTYRKSAVARLSTDVELGETGLPVVCTYDDLAELDRVCRDAGVLIIVKQHHLQKTGNDGESGSGGRPSLTNILFISGKDLKEHDADLYEFMAGTDALLTDYSSVATDYLLLDRPIGYTLDDYEEYEAARGFSFEGVKDYMPGHHICKMDDMKAFISDVAAGNDPHAEWRAKVRPEMQTYTEGFSRRILDYFGI